MKTTYRIAVALVVSLLPGLAFAHPGHEESATFMSGFLHPLLGIDHILAAIAVGLLAAQGKRAWRWSLPATFVACMFVAFVMAREMTAWPAVEMLVTFSLVALGAGYFLGGRVWFISVAAVALFGAVHGFVHGTEIPGDGNWIAYALGLMLATAIAHALGLLMGTRADPRVKLAAKCAAAFIATVGATLLGMQLMG